MCQSLSSVVDTIYDLLTCIYARSNTSILHRIKKTLLVDTVYVPSDSNPRASHMHVFFAVLLWPLRRMPIGQLHFEGPFVDGSFQNASPEVEHQTFH